MAKKIRNIRKTIDTFIFTNLLPNPLQLLKIERVLFVQNLL